VQVRETFDSAMRFGEAALRALGVPEDEAAEIAADVRRRDAHRFELEVAAGDVRAGRPMLRGNKWKPTPLIEPRREGQALNEATQAATAEADAAAGNGPR
jgi:glutathione-regulated potassium-efflux system protein KefB